MFRAFYDLTASRQITMGGEGPIPVSEVYAYCQMEGIDDPDERVAFLRLIRAMDHAYLSERRKAADEGKDEEEKQGGRTPSQKD